MARSPPPPASGAQYAHQFLNTALSQRGPSALPYAEDVKWLIRNHLVALADVFPSLSPRVALFTHRFPASPQLPARPPPAEDPAEVFRRNAIAKLVDTAYADAATLRTAHEAEVDVLLAVRAELRGRGTFVDGGVGRVTEEMEALERRLQDVSMATDVIEAWVAENRKEAADDAAAEAEGAIQPADALARQMLDCTAADLALEDAIYALDKAVQEGSVPFDGYLRSVRALAREQFFQRVLCTKVNSAQQQAQVGRMAARAPPRYAS